MLKATLGKNAGQTVETQELKATLDSEQKQMDVNLGPKNSGLSAYEVWLKAGNSGTVEDYLESLKGKDYVLTSEDKTQIAQQAAKMVKVPELPEDTVTEKWVKEYAQPKGDYISKEQLESAVEEAVKDLDVDVDLSGLATKEELNKVEEKIPDVPEWAKQPSKPSYSKSEVGLGNVDNVKQYSDSNPPPYPVMSVNGQTGDVEVEPKGTGEQKVAQHNTSEDAHNDIRLILENLITKVNTLLDSDDTTLDQTKEIVAYIKANRGLIESVTTSKVNASDIIDNLTTSASDKPLSAKQGVMLKGLIDAIPVYTLPTASSSTLGGVKIGKNINILNGAISVPEADGTVAGVTVVYPAASCTTFTSDKGTVTPLAVQKAAKQFAITRPSATIVNAIARYINNTGDVQNSKITIEDVTNTKDSSKKAQVLVIPAEGGKKMVYGYCTDQVDGTSFIGGVFDDGDTLYPYNKGLAIGGTSGNLLWKGKRVLDANDLTDLNSAINGKLSTSGTAAKATADANGKNIADTYATKDNVNVTIEQLDSQKVDIEGLTLGVGEDGLIYIFANGNKQGNGLSFGGNISGDIVGYIEEGNVIALSGNLPDGTYTLTYEDSEGNIAVVGTIKQGAYEPVTTNIPLTWELGIKLSKTDSSYEEVSTDHNTQTTTYAASQRIDVDPDAAYTLRMEQIAFHGMSICCYNDRGAMVEYKSNVLGTNHVDEQPGEYEFTIPTGATYIRLRWAVPINQNNTAAYKMSAAKVTLKMTK